MSDADADSPPMPRVLIVDDAPENVEILAGILGGVCRPLVALDGPKALEIVRRGPPPDLVLLDVVMPGMDGYEVCRRLKADPETSEIPVIFVTARSEVTDEETGFALGAVDFIAKPYNAPIVVARVRTQLALKEARDRIRRFSEKLARYVSPQIRQSILEGRQDARIGASRRKLTVFFSDIVGFSSQTDQMEPEDLTQLLNSYLDRMAVIALEHGGTLDKFIGDAVLVFFGDPESRGTREDALACVRMALDMQGAIEELRADWREKGIVSDFAVRMGVTTGYCTVGNFGSEARMDYTIVGNQVNLASRLESNAPPGTILIAEETHALVSDAILCESRPPIDAKGFEHPIPVHCVVGRREEAGGAVRIEEDRPGCSLRFDPSAIREDDRGAVAEALREALMALRR